MDRIKEGELILLSFLSKEEKRKFYRFSWMEFNFAYASMIGVILGSACYLVLSSFLN